MRLCTRIPKSAIQVLLMVLVAVVRLRYTKPRMKRFISTIVLSVFCLTSLSAQNTGSSGSLGSSKPSAPPIPAFLTAAGLISQVIGIGLFSSKTGQRETFLNYVADYNSLGPTATPNDFLASRQLIEGAYGEVRDNYIVSFSLIGAGIITTVVGLLLGGVDTLVPIPISLEGEVNHGIVGGDSP